MGYRSRRSRVIEGGGDLPCPCRRFRAAEGLVLTAASTMARVRRDAVAHSGGQDRPWMEDYDIPGPRGIDNRRPVTEDPTSSGTQ